MIDENGFFAGFPRPTEFLKVVNVNVNNLPTAVQCQADGELFHSRVRGIQLGVPPTPNPVGANAISAGVSQIPNFNFAAPNARQRESDIFPYLADFADAVAISDDVDVDVEYAPDVQPLTVNQIGTLPEQTVDEVLISKVSHCPICLEPFTLGGNVTSLVCPHVFHKECIVPWLSKQGTCPQCRAPQAP